MKSVGQNIKKIRKEKGITQEEMAKILGISRSYLANLEAGRKNVGENTINKMAEKSGMSAYYLTTGEKTTYDMNVVELDKLVEDEVHSILKEVKKKPDEKLKESLLELSNTHLSAIEVIYLLNAINYLHDATTEELKVIASILRSLLYNKDVLNRKPIFPEDAEPVKKEDVLKDIEDVTQELNKLLRNRYGLKEKSD